jgi:hypothetical protein
MDIAYRDKKVVGVFCWRFYLRAPLQRQYNRIEILPFRKIQTFINDSPVKEFTSITGVKLILIDAHILANKSVR